MSIREADLSSSRSDASDPTTSFTFPAHSPTQVIAWLDRKRKAAVETRPDWRPKLNLAYFFGLQFLRREDIARATSTVRRRTSATRRNRPVRVAANRLAAIIENTVGALSSNPLIPEVRPNASDDTDMSAARAGTRIIIHEHERVDGRSLAQEALFWAAICGWCYDFCAFDPSLGRVIPTEDELGNPVAVRLGEIVREILPPFEASIDPASRREDLLDARYFTRSIALPKEEVWERYGKVPSDAKPAAAVSDELGFFLELGDALGLSFERFRDWQSRLVVHQHWHLPSRAAPDGLLLTYSGQTILEGWDRETNSYAPYPYDHGRLPISQLSFFPGLIRREGRTWTDDEVSMQADYNDSRSRVATIRRVMTPFLVTGHNSVDTKRWANRVQVIEVKPTTTLAPDFRLPDGRWATVFEKGMDRAEKEMDARAGVSGPGGIEGPRGTSNLSAAALLAMQEQASKPLVVPATRLSSFVRRAWWQHLSLVKQFWTLPRIIATQSEEANRLEVQRFMGSDIADELDVHLTVESALPRMKVAKIQFAIEMLDRQFITDPHIFFSLVDLPEFSVLSRTYNKAAAQADRENEKLIQGEPVKVRARHVHETHLSRHLELTMAPEYEKAPLELQAVVDAHIQVHEEAMALAVAGIAQAQLEGALDPARAAAVNALSPVTPPQSLAGRGLIPPPSNPAVLGALTGGNLGGGGENPAQRRGSLRTSLRSLSGVGAPGQPFQAQEPGGSVDLRPTQL